MATDLQRKSKWVQAAIGPASDILDKSIRGLVDLPASVSEGAKEVAQLTAWRSAQLYALDVIWPALDKLSKLPDWDKPFMVANSVNYNWKTAPIKRWNSFKDFYQEELEATWGAWTDLQQTYAELIAGKITKDQAVDRVRRSAFEQIEAIKDVRTARKQGRPPKEKKVAENNATFSIGRGASYRLSRLKRDAPEIADRYIAGEFKSVASADRAAKGLLDGAEKLKRRWLKATVEDRAAFMRWLKEEGYEQEGLRQDRGGPE